MRRSLLSLPLYILPAAVFAVLICARWFLILARSLPYITNIPASAPLLLGIIVATLLIIGYYVCKPKLFFIAAFAGSIMLFCCMQYIVSTFSQVWYPAIFAVFLIAAAISVLGFFRRKYTVASLGIVILANMFPHLSWLLTPLQSEPQRLDGGALLLGDSVANAAAAFESLPGYHYWLSLILLVCALCTTITVSLAIIHKRDTLPSLYQGCRLGLFAGIWLMLSQQALYCAMLIWGFSITHVVSSFLIIQCLMSIFIWAAVKASSSNSRYILLRCAPALFAALLVVPLSITFYGSSDFARLESFHNDTTWAYVHFNSSGGWRRTLDHSYSATRLWSTERFIETYPYSVYRAASMLKLAELYFDAWQFDDASETLTAFTRDYPNMRDRILIMQSLTDLAKGKPDTILSPEPNSPHFDSWRRTKGAQMAGFAAIRKGQPSRALGYISYYLDYLKGRQPAVWIQPSITYITSTADDVISKQRRGTDPVAYARQVRCRVAIGRKPIQGARVILVQPHFDAALPADSRQFSGAWSIPPWNGCSGVTNSSGEAIINHVPCGRYEVVVGLNYQICPPGYVVSEPIAPVELRSGTLKTIDIKLVPAVKITSPRNGDLISAHTSISWQKFPNAASYSVSILRVSLPANQLSNLSLASSQETCWARSGISSCSTSIDPGHFLGDIKSLESGNLYMCLVYAYSANGSMLSSSEHYFDLRETVFTVR